MNNNENNNLNNNLIMKNSEKLNSSKTFATWEHNKTYLKLKQQQIMNENKISESREYSQSSNLSELDCLENILMDLENKNENENIKEKKELEKRLSELLILKLQAVNNEDFEIAEKYKKEILMLQKELNIENFSLEYNNLLDAARKNDFETIHSLIKTNPRCINSIDSNTGQTVLHYATIIANETLCKFLIDCGLKLFFKNKRKLFICF